MTKTGQPSRKKPASRTGVKLAYKVTNLRFSIVCHTRAKACAHILGEQLYQFVETAINERIERLKKEGRLEL